MDRPKGLRMLNKYWLAFVCLFPAISMAQFESQISDARSFVSSASPSSTSEALNSSFNSKATNIGSSDPILGGAKAPTTSGQGTLSQQGANNIAICNSNPSAPGCDAVKMMANYSPTNSISIKPNDPMLSAAQSAINANGAGGPFSPGTQCNPVKTTKGTISTGIDTISNKVLKMLPDSALSHLTTMLNGSLKLSFLPDSWKMAKIKVLRKFRSL